MAVVLGRKGGGAGGGGAPSGPSGGDLGGTYPNPTLSVAKEAELDGKLDTSTYDANTVLAANADNTPLALTMGASTILARLAAGNIKAATPAELRTLLALVIGTNVTAAGYADFNGQAGAILPTANGWSAGGGAFTANRVFLTRFVLSKDFTAASLKFRTTTAGTGNVDAGIYDSTLANKLASSGSTSGKKGANTTQTVTFSATVALTAGTVYYAAIEADVGDGACAAANFGSSLHDQFFGTAAPTAESLFKDTTYPLPASIATPTASNTIGPIFALV